MPTRKLEIEMLLKDKKVLKSLASDLKKIEKNSSRAAKGAGLHWVNLTSQIFLARQAWALFDRTVISSGKTLLATGAKFERLEVELQAFTKNAAEAKKVVQDLTEFSAETPFQLENVISGAKLLLPLRDQGEELDQVLTAAGNAAAAFGISIEQSALQISKVFSSGIGAADLFRDRGVRALVEAKIGLDLTTLSAKEAGQAMVEALTSGELGQATLRLSKTFEGLSSTIKDNISLIFKDISQAGFFDEMKAQAAGLLAFITELREDTDKYQETVEALGEAFVGFAQLGLSAIGGLVFGVAQITDVFAGIQLGILQAQLAWEKFRFAVAGGDAATQGNMMEQIIGLENREDLSLQVEEVINNIKSQIETAREEIGSQPSLLAVGAGGEADAEAAKSNLDSFVSNFNSGLGIAKTETKSLFKDFSKGMGAATKQASTMFAGTISQIILGQKSAKEAFKELGISIAEVFIKFAIQLATQQAIALAAQAIIGATVKTTMAGIAATAAPAAALVSLASFGGNAPPAIAGMVAAAGVAEAIAAVSTVAGAVDGGTTLKPGDFIIGERGPERVRVPKGTEITPHGAQPSGSVVNVNINIENASLRDESSISELAREVSEFIAVELNRL